MFKNSVLKLTIIYIIIVTILCASVSTIIYISIVKNSANLFIQEQTRIEKRFGSEDPRYARKLQFVEDGINSIQKKALINLVGINMLIITVVGVLSYFFAKVTIAPIEENLRRQKEFISNVSHELKTPLTALKTTFEIDLKTKGTNLADTIKSGIEEVDKLNSLINGFLKLSNLDDKKTEIKSEIFRLDTVIEDIIKRNQHFILKKNLNLKTEFQEIKIKSNKFLITEVLAIIIDNAIKFSPVNEEIFIKSYREGKNGFISIKDKGKGIKEENLNKIFERFYKEDPSRGTDSGIGIGLAIAKDLAELIGCQIIAKRNNDVGSEFIIKFSD